MLVNGRVLGDGAGLQVSLTWLSLAPVSEDLTVFLHLYDNQNRLIAQEDGYPLGGLFPFRFWRAGSLVQDIRRLPLPAGLIEGDYVVAVGVYDRASGARRSAADQTGAPYPDNAVPLTRRQFPRVGH